MEATALPTESQPLPQNMNFLLFVSEGYPALVFPTMHLLAESWNLHVISTAWDLQFLKCLAESTQHKSAVVEVSDMRSGDKATKTGKLFYETLKVSGSLKRP